MNHFLVLGSHPLLSLAEAKAVLGEQKPQIADKLAVFEHLPLEIDALNKRLGGSVKMGEIVTILPMRELSAERLADEIEARPRADKIQYGLTIFGGSEGQRQKTKHLPIELKRVLQDRGHAVRWVTGEDGELSPAAVAKLDLINAGYDLVIGLFGEEAMIGLTTQVQDADAWSERDYGRPFRDMETGMLPPKLARMMVNIATGSTQHLSKMTLLDPFCGGGTVLMEAALVSVGHAFGSDIDAKQIAGAKKNLDWMVEKMLLKKEARHTIDLHTRPVETIDTHFAPDSVDVIVTEGYLGKPLRGNETLPFLHQQKQAVETIWRNALKAFLPLLKTGGRIVCVWPVFTTTGGTVAADVRTDAIDLGYRFVEPLADWKEKSVTLTYARADQHVKRNIVILEKK